MFTEITKLYVKNVKSGRLRGPLWEMSVADQIGAAMFMWGGNNPAYAAAKLFWLFYEKGSASTWIACSAIVDKVGTTAFQEALNPDPE